MGKFKQHLINEDIGLADLGPRIERFYNSPYLDSKINASFSNNKYKDPVLFGKTENTTLSIPSIEKKGKIVKLYNKRNPIYIRLSDGTEAHFSYDEYRKIQGKPEIGKTMTLVFQRHPEDNSQQASKINKAIVLD